MSLETLHRLDLSAGSEPGPDLDRREYLVAWLRYQRHEFLRKTRDLSPAQLVAQSVPPVELSVMGLVRHMTQMELHYVVFGLGGVEQEMPYGEADYAGATVETIDEDLVSYFAAVAASDQATSAWPDLEEPGVGTGRSLEMTLVKMIDEYALHAGQAHMIRFAALGELRR